MFGRITHFRGDASRLDEMVSRLPAIRDQIAQIEGGLANYAMWNDDGSGVAVALYSDEATANAATPQIQAIWGGLSDLLLAPPEIKSYTHAEQMRD
jgi:hypothetical protein